MIDIDNQSNLSIPLSVITKIHAALTDKELELLIVNDDEMRQINSEHRGVDKSTDVLSFPFEEHPMSPLGSLVISADHVKTAAEHFKHSQDDEFCLLFIHGLLHLLGYDHEVDEGQMRQKEKELIEKFELPNSLIIRTQG